MSIQIIPKAQQGHGAFNGGEIKENKPIGFPQDGGPIKPYSNLFYWAHAWSDNGSTLGEHPHQGFEILSFILDGEIKHYDSMKGDWNPLSAGDVQIMRAGKGLSHSEILNPGSSIFQIWLDPDLSRTLAQTASYNDYRSAELPVREQDGISYKTYLGKGSPVQLDTPGVSIEQLSFSEGSYELLLDKEYIHSFYLIEGEVQLNDMTLMTDDFAVVKDIDTLTLQGAAPRLFYVRSPLRVGYMTYVEHMQRQMQQRMQTRAGG